MITYMPLPSILDSVAALPSGVLRPQLIDCLNILEHLSGFRAGMLYAPAVQMWVGAARGLFIYTDAIQERMDAEKLSSPSIQVTKDKIRIATTMILEQEAFAEHPSDSSPFWLGDDRVHASHRSRLLTNYPQAVSRFNWTEPQHLTIFWPGPKPKPKPPMPESAPPRPETAPPATGVAEEGGEDDAS